MDDLDGSVSRDYAASCRYRQQVLDYTRWSLGLGPVSQSQSITSNGGIWGKLLSWFRRSGPSKWDVSPPAPNLPNTVFKEYGFRTQMRTSKSLYYLPFPHRLST